MLHSARRLDGSVVVARDGDIGHVEDFYFDDERWTVRHLVVNTGVWLFGRKVLISPIAVRFADWENRRIELGLTREQVRQSPPIDADRPISRQEEETYYRYYGWPPYWTVGPGLWGWGAYPGLLGPGAVLATEDESNPTEYEIEQRQHDPHLRSGREVTGYAIQAADGAIGHVDDFLLDDETWAIRYLAVDTRDWWPGKKVLIPPEWIDRVSWDERAVFVETTRERIRSAPEWLPGSPIERSYEERLYAHYGRTPYWEEPMQTRRAA